LEKCAFLKPDVRHLGFTIWVAQGQRPGKIQAIRSMAEAKNVVQPRTFLGVVGYYSSFMPTIKQRRRPLDVLLKSDVEREWKNQHVKTF
uniref:Reverse transcriptase domain-containing protein n=1 Tax=Heligmosomoides polygyrus TaxID=6339 RepID=A0A183FUY3_HELPZ